MPETIEDLQRRISKLEGRIEEKDETIARLVKSKSELEIEVGRLNNQLKHEREARLKEIIMPLLRGEFEEFEQLYLPAIKLSKSDMVNNIKQSNPFFSIPSSIAKNENLSIHYVAMRYILKNSSDSKVTNFKAYLHSKGVDDDFIAQVAGIFYKKSSAATHTILTSLSLDDIEIGLKANGIEDAKYVIVVKSLYAFRRNRAGELI